MITGLLVGLLSLSPLPSGGSTSAVSGNVLAIRVGKAETASHGTLEHAVILVEGDKITAVGEDLPIERGIPILDRPDWVVTPGFVDCFSRLGLDGRGGNSFEPQAMASQELYPDQEVYREVALENGVTTLGLYPAGTGVSGQAVAVRPKGDTAEEMIIADGVYLTMYMATNARSKKMFRDAFAKADKYLEKVEKAREKWEKAEEKRKKKKKSKDKDDEEDNGPTEFVPPEPDAEVVPILALREKELRALISLQKSSDYLHLLDALGDEDIDYDLRVPLRNDIDLYEIAERVGERGLRIVLTAQTTLQPSSRRERNLPAEFARAGAKLVLAPRYDFRRRSDDLEHWVPHVAELIARGLDRQTAISAMTLEAANVLGLGERLGSIDIGKDANLVFWNGDPFEPGSEIQAVMLEGDIVHGEVNL